LRRSKRLPHFHAAAMEEAFYGHRFAFNAEERKWSEKMLNVHFVGKEIGC
jgi:hypothetical protein